MPTFHGALWHAVDFLHKEKRPASLQAVDFTGVPNRIRTGVTAVKERLLVREQKYPVFMSSAR